MSKQEPNCVVISSGSDCEVQCTGVKQVSRVAPAASKKLVTFVKRQGDRYVAAGMGYLVPGPQTPQVGGLPRPDKKPVVIDLSSDEEPSKTKKVIKTSNSQQSEGASSLVERNNNQQKTTHTDDEFETPSFKPATERCVTNTSNSRKKIRLSSSQSSSSSAERKNKENKKRNRNLRTFDSGSDISQKSSSKRQKVSSNEDEPCTSASSLARSPSSMKKKKLRQRTEERRKRHFQDKCVSSSDDETGVSDLETGSPFSRYAKMKRTISPKSAIYKLNLPDCEPAESSVKAEGSKARKRLELERKESSSSTCLSASKNEQNLSSASTQPPSGYEKNSSSVSTLPPENNDSSSSDIIPNLDEPKTMMVQPPETPFDKNKQIISSVRTLLHNLKQKKMTLFPNLTNDSATCSAKSSQLEKEASACIGHQEPVSSDTASTIPPEDAKVKECDTSDPDLDVPLSGLMNNLKKSPMSDKVITKAGTGSARLTPGFWAGLSEEAAAKPKQLIGNNTSQTQDRDSGRNRSRFHHEHFGKLKSILQMVAEEKNSGSSAHDEDGASNRSKISQFSSGSNIKFQGVKALSDSTYDSPLSKDQTAGGAQGVNALSDSPYDTIGSPITNEEDKVRDDPPVGEEDESNLDEEYLLDEIPSRTAPNAKELVDWTLDLDVDLGPNEHESHGTDSAEDREIQSSESQNMRDNRLLPNIVRNEGVRHSTPRVEHDRIRLQSVKPSILSLVPEEEMLTAAAQTEPVLACSTSLKPIAETSKPVDDDSVASTSETVVQVKKEPELFVERELKESAMIHLTGETNIHVKTDTPLDVGAVRIKTEPGLDGEFVLPFIKKEENAEVGEGWVYSQEDGVITIYDSDDDYMREMSQHSMMVDSSDSDVLCNDTIEEVVMKEEISKQALAEVWAQLEEICPRLDGEKRLDIGGHSGDEDRGGMRRALSYEDDDSCDDIGDDVTPDDEEEKEREVDDGSDGIGGGWVEERSENESDNELGFKSQGFNVDHFRETEFMSQGFTAHQSFQETEEESEDENWWKTSEVEKTSAEEEGRYESSEDSIIIKKKKCHVQLVESELSDDGLPSLVHTRRDERKRLDAAKVSSDVDLEEQFDIEKLLETSGESDNEILNDLSKKGGEESVAPDTHLSSSGSKSSNMFEAETSEGTKQNRHRFALDKTAQERLKLSLGKVLSSDYNSKLAATKDAGKCESQHPKDSNKQSKAKKSGEKDLEKDSERECAKERHPSSGVTSSKTKNIGAKSKSKKSKHSFRFQTEHSSDKLRHSSGSSTRSKSSSKQGKQMMTSSTKLAESKAISHVEPKQKETTSESSRNKSKQCSGESVKTSTSKLSEGSHGTVGSDRRSSSESSLSLDLRLSSVESAHSLVIDMEDADLDNQGHLDLDHVSDHDEIAMNTMPPAEPPVRPFQTASDKKLKAVKRKVMSVSDHDDVAMNTVPSTEPPVRPFQTVSDKKLKAVKHKVMSVSDHDDVAMDTVPSAEPLVRPFQTASDQKLKAVKHKVMSNFNPKLTQLTVPQQDKRLEWKYKRQEKEREKDGRRRKRWEKKLRKDKEASLKKGREKDERSDSCDGEAASFYRPSTLPQRRFSKPAPIPSPDEAHSDEREDTGWLTSVAMKPPKKRPGSLTEQTKKLMQGCKQAEVDRRQLSRELKEKHRENKARPAAAGREPAVSSNCPLGSFRIPLLRNSSGETGPGASISSADPGHSKAKDTHGNAGQVAPPSKQKKKPVQRGFSSRQAILTETMLQTKKPGSRKPPAIKPAPKNDGKQPAGRRASDDKSTSARNDGHHSKLSAESKVASVSQPVKGHRRKQRTVSTDESALLELACEQNAVIKSGGITERTFKPIQEGGESPMDEGPTPDLPEEPTGDTRLVVPREEAAGDIRIVVREKTFIKKNGDQVVGILKEPGVRKPKGSLRWDPGVKSPVPRPIRSNQFQAELPDSQEIQEPAEQADGRCLPIPRNDQNISLPALLDDFVLYILNWNYNWLKEQEKLTFPPPIIETGRIHPNQRTFDTIIDYYKVFTPYILLETWQKMFNDHIKRASPQFSQDIVITGLKAQQGNSQQMRSMDLICKVKIKKGDQLLFQEDDLVRVTVQLAETGAYVTMLAFVKKVTVVPINPTDINDPYLACCWTGLDHRDLIQNYDIAIFKMTLKFKKIIYAPGTVIPVHTVSSLSMAIRQFSAMYYLSKNMPLRKHILKPNRPNVFNEGTAILDKKVMETVDSLQSAGYHKDQADAICIAAKAALQPYTLARIILIKGPAGSGKSHMVPEIIKQIMKLEKDWIEGKPKILLCAPNDCALDNVVRKILKKKTDLKINLLRIGSKHVHPEVAPFCLDKLVKMQAENLAKFERNAHVSDVRNDLLQLEDSINRNIARIECLRLDGRANSMKEAKGLEEVVTRERTRKENQQKIYDHLVEHASNDAMIKRRFKDAEIKQDLLHATEVICCVLNSPEASVLMDHFKMNLKGQQGNARQLKFTCAIIDEATSCTELDTLIPLQFGTSKLILLGDTEQLQANVAAETSYKLRLGCSLFKRLIEYWHFKSEPFHRPVLELRMLHRASPEIMKFPWKHFYKQDKYPPYTTRTDRSDKASRILPYLVFDIIEKQMPESRGDSLEMAFLLELCETIKKQSSNTKIVILPPTDDLKKEIRTRFSQANVRNVDILRYHSLQGKEYPVVIIPCFHIGNNMDPIGDLADARKCLVALTRAQKALYICGRMQNIVKRSDMWKKLVDDAANRSQLIKVQYKTDARLIKRCGD